MQNENPTTFSSDRPAQQGIEGQAPRIKHSTHQHHHDNDPLVGSYMGLEVADMSNPVEGEQQDVNQGAGDQQVPEGSVDKSSIFDRDTSQDESVRSKDESQGVQGEQDWGSSSATSSSGHGRQTMTSDVNKQSTDLTRLAAKQGGDWAQFPSSDLGQSSDFGSGASKDWEGQGQGQEQQQQQQQQQQQENWAQFPSSDIGSSSGGQNQDWALPSGVSQGEQAPLSSSAKQEDWAQFSSIGQSSDIGGNSSSSGSGNKDWDASQSTGLLEGSQGSSEMQGVDRSQWPQNQGVWNPSLQGDSSSADKGISQQYDAGASNLSEQSGVTRDEGPYGMDIQGQQSRDEGSSKDQFGSSSDEPLSSWPGGQSGEAAKWSTNFGSQSVTDQGQQDLGESRKYGESGDFSYGGDTTSSVGQGREQGLSNSGASSDLGSAGQAGESNVRDFGKGDFGSEQGRVFGDSAGDVSESNVHDFGRGDLGEQSKLSGDKSTFSADAEEKGWGQQEGLRKNAGEGDDRVHGMAQEDFI